MAKKSLLGENVRLVHTLEVLKASMSWPVGTSKVRIIESSDVTTSHRESGENVYSLKLERCHFRIRRSGAYQVKYSPPESTQLSHYPPCLYVHHADDHVIAYHR